MRPGTIGVVALLLATSLATARADDSLFSAAGTTRSAKPLAKVTFDPVPRDTIAAIRAAKRDGPLEATDCKMIKPVDPQFKSKMPVVTPDEKVTFTVQVVEVPSCKK